MSMLDTPRSIQLFRGFGDGHSVCVSGQVTFGRHLSVKRPRDPEQRRRLWHRLIAALRLAVSARVPGARVRIHCGGAVREVTADRHGYFATCLQLPPQKISPLWREYLVELVAPRGEEEITARGEILAATPAARRVIVSDIDDTVIFTGVSNKLKMLWRLFAQGAHDRVPFPGIAALYRGLHAGPKGDEQNPMIYVSRSPWSIYPMLEEFFQLHHIPIGPVLQLRDWGVSLRHPFPRPARGHKRELVERILAVYPTLPLVLIGDSGQRDPELYVSTARRHPGRVAAIYVRDLQLAHRRSAVLGAMQAEMEGFGVPMVVAASTEEMAVNAARRGWISGSDLEEVHALFARGLA
jgi:phosphatidate phosphatase APP1